MERKKVNRYGIYNYKIYYRIWEKYNIKWYCTVEDMGIDVELACEDGLTQL